MINLYEISKFRTELSSKIRRHNARTKQHSNVKQTQFECEDNQEP